MKTSLPYFHQPDQATNPPFPYAWPALAVLLSQEPERSARDWLRSQNKLRRLQLKELPPLVEIQFDNSFLYEWREVVRGSSLPPIVSYILNRDTDRRAYCARREFANQMAQEMLSQQINPQYDVYLVFAAETSPFLGYDDMNRETKRLVAMMEIEGWVFERGAQATATAICDTIVRIETEAAA